MARFTLPSGLRVTGEQAAASDAEIRAYENQQPSGTRMLVQVGFAFKWPGFGVAADAADWALRTHSSLAGLGTWPEGTRMVTADEDGEAVWWIAYRSSPAWWIPIAIILVLFILAAIVLLVVRKIDPELGNSLTGIFQILPLVLVMGLMTSLPNMTKGFLPWTRDRTKE